MPTLPTAPEVLLERSGHVATVVLNRPEKRNALSDALYRRLTALFAELDADASVRVVVLTGAGAHFSAGADIGELADHHKGDAPTGAEAAIAACHKPVIAAISGYCLGAGLQLAAACDLRIAATDALFGVPPARLGVVYPLSATRRLVALMGPGTTKHLIYTAERIDARRAHARGLVDELVEPGALRDRAATLAAQIAGLSQLTVQATKEIIDHLVADDLPDGLVESWVARADAGPDLAEGMASFRERRPPRFTWTRPGA